MLGNTALGASSPANPAYLMKMAIMHASSRIDGNSSADLFKEEEKKVQKWNGFTNLDHSSSIVTDKRLDIFGVSHFLFICRSITHKTIYLLTGIGFFS